MKGRPRVSKVRLALLLFSLLLLLLVGGFWWLTQSSESVPRTVIPFSDMRKYRQWLDDYHPARLEEGETYRITLTQEDVQKLAILLASTQPALAHTQFRSAITPQALTLDIWWPTRLFDRYLPLRVVWHPQTPFQIRSLTIGGVPMPERLVQYLNDRLQRQPDVMQARKIWEQLAPQIVLKPKAVTISIDWEGFDLYGSLGNFAPFWADPRQMELLRAEVVWLGGWLQAEDRFRIPLRDVLVAMMTREAFEWDRDSSAMLGALTYASLGKVSGLYPGEDLPELPFKRFTLHGRYDLARHFLLAMWLGTQMHSDSVLELATYKEWSDAMTRRSGFSAEDLIANVAGLELLLELQQSTEDGRQDFRPLTDDILMPPADFWNRWATDNGSALTERQIRNLVQSTRDWLSEEGSERQ